MKEEQKNIFAERLGKLRTQKKLSQEELAKVVNIDRGTIAKYETKKRIPSFEHLTAFAIFFNTTTDYLLGLTGVQPKDADLTAVCKFTGLTEGAVLAIKNTPHEWSLSELLELELCENGAVDLMSEYIELAAFPNPDQSIIISKSGEVRFDDSEEGFGADELDDIGEFHVNELMQNIIFNRILSRLINIKMYGYNKVQKDNEYTKKWREKESVRRAEYEKLPNGGLIPFDETDIYKAMLREMEKEALNNGKHNPKKE